MKVIKRSPVKIRTGIIKRKITAQYDGGPKIPPPVVIGGSFNRKIMDANIPPIQRANFCFQFNFIPPKLYINLRSKSRKKWVSE